MNDGHELEMLLRAGTPLVLVETHEEARAVELCARIGRRMHKPVFRWSVTEGLRRLDRDLGVQRHNADPFNVLGQIKSSNVAGLYLLLDFHPHLDDPVIVRLLKDIALAHEANGATVVLVSHALRPPPELARFCARLVLMPPDENALRRLVEEIAREWSSSHPGRTVQADPEATRLLVRNLRGLNESDARRLARKAIFDDGAVTASDLPQVMRAKYELLNRDGVLSFEFDSAHLADVGGQERLKRWLGERRAAFLDPGTVPGLDPPRGILLLGVQGAGKSLAARACAGALGVPLLRLDFGTLYNKYYGETERNLREALRTASVMAPCVLWMDEIEKGLAPEDTDSGPSRRVLGTLLTWLAEPHSGVFLVATANDIAALPPELVRKGRFDEIFFVDLPRAGVRRTIFGIHLRKRALDPQAFDLDALAGATDGFTGAEIEQVVVSALYAAHARGEQPATGHMQDAARLTRPLSVVMAERVQSLRAWAADRTVAAD